MRQRRYDRALAELRLAEQLDPSYALQHFYLAQLYRIQGRDRDSLRALFRGITLDPSAMVEQRLFARTEGRVAGGANGTVEADAHTDGRASNGRISYFLSGAHLESDGPRRNDDQTLDFMEGILGYQPGPKHNLAFFTSLIDDRGGRPGNRTAAGPETPLFRYDLSGADFQLMSRWQIDRQKALTLKTGYRKLSALGKDPLAFFTLLGFRNREENIYVESRYEQRLDAESAVQAGVSWVRSIRTFDGRFDPVTPPTPGPVPARVSAAAARKGLTRDRTEPDLLTAYLEYHRQLDRRTHLIVGPYLGLHSDDTDVLLPKFVLRHQLADDSTLALLGYPIFLDRYADLRPVETWSRPFDLGRLSQDDGGRLMSYELTWQKGLERAALLTATAFYRKAHDLLVPIVDPSAHGLATRAFFARGELFGGELGYERWLTETLTARFFGRYQDTRSLMGEAELPYFPRWTAGARLDYVDRNGIRASLGGTYVGRRRHVDFAGGPGRRVGSHILLDLRLEWQMDVKNNFFIEIRDLLDRRPGFFHDYPANGRTILGGIERRL
jgi:hypothetical protein